MSRDQYLQQLQLHLLRCYSAIEQKLRSWCPGADWGDEEIALLKAEYQKRDDAERMLVQLLNVFQLRPNSDIHCSNAPAKTGDSDEPSRNATAA